jgi:division protein CdvB (Snf7/Vps24/ESCRT-III family)
LNPFSDDKGGGDLKEKISYAIRQIETQRKELDQLRARLDERRRTIFNATVRAIEKSDEMRARLLAGEHVELQKVCHIVNASELALLHIVVRLETLRDVGSVMFVLTTAFKEVKRIGKSIAQITPNLQEAANEINKSFSDVIAELGVLTPNISVALTDTPQEIFHKAEQLIAEQTSAISKLPESLTAQTDSDGTSLFEKTKKIALLATSGDDERQDDEEFKPILLSNDSFGSSAEESVRKYLSEEGDARFDLEEASAKLGIPADKVERLYIKLLGRKAFSSEAKQAREESDILP